MNHKDDQFGIQLPMMRDPVVATSLSVIPGLGQIYNLEPRKGVLFFLVGFTNIILIGTLAWSQQLVNSLTALSTEFNIRPNGDIVHALSGCHAGSPAMNMLFLLFLAFVAYTMRDAYDRAKIVRRNAIYANSVMHISEATSGSYLFHTALMTTLVLFAFFFLMPAPPRVQVTDIEFVNPLIETHKPPKTKNVSSKPAEALHDPKINRIVKNPSANSAGGAKSQQHERAAAKPASESKPAEASKPSQTKPAEAKQPAATKEPAAKASKPADAPAQTKPLEQAPAKPKITPVSQPNSMAPAPNPLRPPTPVKAIPPTPTLGQPTSSTKSAIDPTKLLANLMPTASPTHSAALPSPEQLAVKSNHGAPLLVASNIAPSGARMPQPGIASSSHSSGPSTPKIIEGGSRSNSNGKTGGPSPRGVSSNGRELSFVGNSPVKGNPSGTDTGDSKGTAPTPRRPGDGPKGNDHSGDDVGGLANLKPNLPPGDGGKDSGHKADGEFGRTKDKGREGRPQPPSVAVDFGPYMESLQRRIKRHWFPPTDKSSKRVTVRFTISSNGTMSQLRMAAPSGSAVSDSAALKAVSNAAPFPPLPTGAPESVDIEFKFDYNVFSNTGTLRSW